MGVQDTFFKMRRRFLFYTVAAEGSGWDNGDVHISFMNPEELFGFNPKACFCFWFAISCRFSCLVREVYV